MPNFDSGAYFLTVLIPVKQGMAPMVSEDGMSDWNNRFKRAVEATENTSDIHYGHLTQMSWTQRLKSVLSTLPTALQSPATQRIGLQSPFARNSRNHFTRLVVIDDVVYNGRPASSNPIANTLIPEHVDRLKSPYLLFVAEIDAVCEDGGPLPSKLTQQQQDQVRQSYLEELWETAETELRPVFENCDAFADINSPADFATYCSHYQIESTMSFHDYWTAPPKLRSMSLKVVVPGLLVPLAIGALGLLGWLVTSAITATTGYEWHNNLFFWAMCGGFVVFILAFLLSKAWADALGESAFPPPQHGDLPSVLKGIYLQQKFSDFVVENQDADTAELHRKFGEFLKHNDIHNRQSPTQKPGYVSIKSKGALVTNEGLSA